MHCAPSTVTGALQPPARTAASKLRAACEDQAIWQFLCLPAEGVHGLGDGVQPVGFFETEPCGVADFGFAAR